MSSSPNAASPVPSPNAFKRMLQRVAATDWFAKVAPTIVPPLDRFVHRITGGRILLAQVMLPTMMLTTTGAKSGEKRDAPLATIPWQQDYLVVGSNWGGDKHPAWSYNLIANPEATMSMNGQTHQVKATLLNAQEKAEAWPEITRIWPPYDRYVERSGRDLRVFVLSRIDS